MRHPILCSSFLIVAAAFGSVASAATTPANIKVAVADSNRPAPDTARDAARKPEETLAFAGVKDGASVAELLPGHGYFTRILSKAVGPKGHIYAWVPPAQGDRDFSKGLKDIAGNSTYANVTLVQQGFSKGLAPAPVDLVFTAQNYHDLHNVKEIDVAGFNKAVFDALKPGGVYLVIDHSAEKGSGARDTSTLHRIDKDTVKREVTAAGFQYVGESDVLANPNDARTAKVFDESIRGKTDQFILKFRKPKK